MACGCENNKKEKKCNDFTKAVINIENPEVLTLFHKVVIPASMGDETAVPPAVGKYCNTLVYYEASEHSYLYSSDGIPTLVTGKDGKDGKDGTDGRDGADGKDGVIQYTAGTGINISAQNVISATGSAAVAWGDITGDLENQTDLNNALGAKQDTLTAGDNITIDGNNEISATDTTYNDFVGTDGVSVGTHGLVPAPATTDTNAFLKGDGTWGTPPGTTYTAGTNIQINGSTISATDTTYSDFGGATALVAGSAGLVPAPTTADPDKFLKGDGTWQTPPGTTYTAGTNVNISAQNVISAIDTTYTDFVGTDGITDGDNGLVPAPITSDVDKYLKSDGTWATVASGGSTITMTDTDPGEGSPLAADNYIGVYGGAPFNGDYATAEIDTGSTWIDGKEIYKKTVNFGALPNATTASVDHYISSLSNVIKIEGYMTDGSSWRTLPYADGAFTSVYASTTQVSIYTTANMSSWTGYITLYYTKAII